MRRSLRFAAAVLVLGALAPACLLNAGPFDNEDTGGAGGTSTGTTTTTDPTGGTGGTPTVCSDGVVSESEACDDGNASPGDGCDGACAVESGWVCMNEPGEPSTCSKTCNDGKLDPGEQCEDGNLMSGDGCSDSCQIELGWECEGDPFPNKCHPSCGDGTLDPNEECDLGPDMTGDGCAANCEIEDGWTCTQSGGASMPSECAPTCGDGLLVGMEACDDNNNTAGDGCAANCEVEPGWTCQNAPSTCTSVCGDGLAVGAEACDDGNTKSNDGCSMACALEAMCGNFIVDPGEECDGGAGCTACVLDGGSVCAGAVPIAADVVNGVDPVTGVITTFYENNNSDDLDVLKTDVLAPPTDCIPDYSLPVVHRYTTGKRPSIVTVQSLDKMKDDTATFGNTSIWIYRDCPAQRDLDACATDGAGGKRAKVTTGFIPARTTLTIIHSGDGNTGNGDKGKYRIQITEQPVQLFYLQTFGAAAAPGLDNMLGGLVSTDVGGDGNKWRRCTPGGPDCGPDMSSHSGGAFAWAPDGDNTMLTNTTLVSADIDTQKATTKLFVQVDLRSTDVGGTNEFAKLESSADQGTAWTTLDTFMNLDAEIRSITSPANLSPMLRFKLTFNDTLKDVEPYSADDIHVYGY
ncbi:MAG: DUF4215 domain-containing protein [Polyangiaceae bacterium]